MRISRRQALVAGAATVGAALGARPQAQGRAVTKGRLKQSVCRWTHAKTPLPDCASRSPAWG